MAKSRGVESKLASLQALRHANMTPGPIAELRRALADPSHLVVALAAEIAGARDLAEMAPDLASAFERFMVDPEERDKLCRAKIAIVDTLNKIEYSREEVFLRGIHHVQTAGVWNDPEGDSDPSAPVRAGCAFGLVRINYRGALVLLSDMLLDRANVARLGAVQALGASGLAAAVPLLRFKARIGDRDPAVTAACLAALMQLAPDESLPFLTEFLHAANESFQEGAAFALAESRRPEALAILKDFWPRARGTMQEIVLLAIAMTRLPAALELLLQIIQADDKAAALAALSALVIHRHNDTLKRRIADAVAKKNDAALAARFKDKFGKDCD